MAAPKAQIPEAMSIHVEGSGTGVKLSIRSFPDCETKKPPNPWNSRNPRC